MPGLRSHSWYVEQWDVEARSPHCHSSPGTRGEAMKPYFKAETAGLLYLKQVLFYYVLEG